MLSQFILSKVEELGSEINNEIIYNCLYGKAYIDPIPSLKQNMTDFRDCWKAIKAGHDVRSMLSILSARIERTKDPMKMKVKVDRLIEYVDNYDEYKGEELANIPWESINLWSK